MHELRALVSNENIDIIALTETWINTESKHFLAEFDIPGYSLFKYDRTSKMGGGIAVFVRSSLKCCTKSGIRLNNDNESVWVQVSEGSEIIIIGVI